LYIACISKQLDLHSAASRYLLLLLFIGELFSERCRTDDLSSNVPILGLPPGSVNSKVLGLDVFINRSEPSCSWTSSRFPPVSGWTECGGYDAVVIFCWGRRAKWLKNLRRWDLTTSETGVQAVTSQTVSFVVCLVYGIRGIFRRHQVSNASRRLLIALVMIHVSHPYSRTGRIYIL